MGAGSGMEVECCWKRLIVLLFYFVFNFSSTAKSAFKFRHICVLITLLIRRISSALCILKYRIRNVGFMTHSTKYFHIYSQASVHERLGSRTIRFTNRFSERKASRMTYCVSSYEHASRQNVDKNKSHWTTF